MNFDSNLFTESKPKLAKSDTSPRPKTAPSRTSAVRKHARVSFLSCETWNACAPISLR